MSETSGELRASWSPSVDSGEAPVAVYEVSLNGASPKSGPQLSQVFANLGPNTSYSFQVRACNAVGCSPYSAAVVGTTGTGSNTATTVATAMTTATTTVATTATTTATVTTVVGSVGKLPGVPRSVRIGNVTASSLTISWVVPAANEVGNRYEVSLDGGPPNPGSETSQTWTQLMPATTFSFQVRACNNVGCSPYSAAVAAQTLGAVNVPSSPVKPSVRVVNAGELQVSWSPPVNRAIAPVGTYELIFNNQKAKQTIALTYSLVGVKAKSRYAIRVRACNSAGCSRYSVLIGRVPNFAP